MRCFFIVCVSLLLTQGCGVDTSGLPPDDEYEKSAPEFVGTESLQAALTDLRTDFPQASYRSVLESGSLSAVGETAGTDSLPLTLRRLLLSTVAYRTDTIDEAEVQIQRFRLNQAFQPLRLIGRRINAVIPFRMRGGADVEFARVLREGDSGPTDSFTLLDLPHDAESALRLPQGTVVTLPISGRVSFDVGGSFLTKAASHAPELVPHVQTSAYGRTSSVRRGMLLGEGSFNLQIVRLDDQRVRLRALSSTTLEARAFVNTSAQEGVRYTFLPAAEIDRVRALGRRLRTARTHLDLFRHTDERVASLRAASPEIIKGILDAIPVSQSAAQRDRINELTAGFDRALEKAADLTAPIERLDALIGQHVDTALSYVEDVWTDRALPALDRVRWLSSRVFTVTQSVQLSDEVSRRLRLLADYEFDLSDPEARRAFERALSGQTVWRGAIETIRDWDFEHEPFADFTLAESLAADGQGTEAPAVRRIAAGGSDFRKRRYQTRVRGLGLALGFSGEFGQNRVTLTDHEGLEREWQTRLWEREHNSRWMGDVRSEAFSSGVFTETEDDNLIEGGYWFRWNKEFGDGAPQPIADTLAHAINDLGTSVVSQGLADMYRGEHDGKVRSELMVVINGKALAALFDEDSTQDEVIWATLARMMETYRRPASLPYAHAPIRPRSLQGHEAAMEACEAVARRLGGRYCYSFVDRIIPALRVAQRSGLAEDRLKFFESFYRVPAGGAVLATRVMVRLLMDLLHAIGQPDGVHVELRVRNTADDSEAASPVFRHGDERALELGRTTASKGLGGD